MPIEIRELVIRAQVEPDSSGPTTSRAAPPADSPNQAELIRLCVQEVLRVLEEKRER
ncbi:MAG: hypothetical protein F6K00_18815 [Leptolyngbya sp. SIOISBB]|nr:hypothetical protein [Leptolyngbya sp. SIOISBB]